MNVEKKTASILAQKAYEVILGGRKFKFKPLSLSDREEMSAIASTVKESFGGEIGDGDTLAEAIRYGKYAKQIALFIATGAHVRGFMALVRRRLIYRAAYRNASIEELILCMHSILDHVEPAFFLSIIISLSRQNTLKPTKETEVTVPG
jgi:hypothetical protein